MQDQAEPGVSQQATKPLVLPAVGPSPRSASLPDTRPLPEVSVDFAPLPEGALIHQGQYVVAEVRSVNQRQNVYLVEDTTPARLCPDCRTGTANPEEQFCSSCGADLNSVGPLHLRYLIREDRDEQAFAVEAQLLEMRLQHPGLLLPRDVFAEAPYGPERAYLVEQEFSPPLATALPVPQELNRVLEWGLSLAQALEYLHRHHVTLRRASLEHVAVQGETVCWVHFDGAHVIAPAERPTPPSQFTQDVADLVETLLFLATGKRRYSADLQLPEPAARLFSQALSTPAGITAAALANSLKSTLEELRHPTSVTLVVGRRADVGQERVLNEDSLLTLAIVPVFRSVSAPVGVFAVADGMGGHEAGDVASQLALRVAAQHALGEVVGPAAVGEPLPDSRQWLTAATQAANRAVFEQRRAAGSDMGTTLVIALLVGCTATIANVGDSRAYLLAEDGISRITTDHSVVERLVATHQISRGEAADHPQQNVIYRVIGDKARLDVDLFERSLNPGDALLLCSDGLSGMVADDEAWHIWRTSTSPQEACDRLVEAANQAGGEDNIAVVIVQAGR
jgi:protein phosphatase